MESFSLKPVQSSSEFVHAEGCHVEKQCALKKPSFVSPIVSTAESASFRMGVAEWRRQLQVHSTKTKVDQDELKSAQDGSAGILPPSSPPTERRMPLAEGLLLVKDYSGMVELEHGKYSLSDTELLGAANPQARSALRAQLELAESGDEFRTVLHLFRNFLLHIPLPSPCSVGAKQALKDVGRESVFIEGHGIVSSDVEVVQVVLRRKVSSIVFDKAVEESLVEDILRASSRTSWGGDSYAVVRALVAKEGCPVTPAPLSEPVRIIFSSVERSSCEADVTIEAKSAFFVHWGGVERPVRVPASQSRESGAATLASKLWSRWTKEQPNHPAMSSECSKLLVEVSTCVSLHLLDGSCKRSVSLVCPAIEQCPAQCLVLGAGQENVNGTFDMLGFEQGAPVYRNNKGIFLSFQGDGRASRWLFEDRSTKVTHQLYRAPKASRRAPLQLHPVPDAGSQVKDNESKVEECLLAPPTSGYTAVGDDAVRAASSPELMHLTSRIKVGASASGRRCDEGRTHSMQCPGTRNIGGRRLSLDRFAVSEPLDELGAPGDGRT